MVPDEPMVVKHQGRQSLNFNFPATVNLSEAEGWQQRRAQVSLMSWCQVSDQAHLIKAKLIQIQPED